MFTVKEKASLIAIIANVILTAIKFIVFFFSGSIAILAEAYHSFSDIFTSFLTYYSVRGGKSTESETDKKEFMVSVGIGIFLLLVSVNIFLTVAKSDIYSIKFPLYSGIIFLFFSCLSYIVYKFEFMVSISEKSSSLYSDSLHSKTDMISSLITGFSLILYHMGYNFDKVAAIFIGIMIFSFSIDIMVNGFLRRFRKELDPAEYHLIDMMFKTELYSKMKPFIKKTFILFMVLLLLAYLSTCFIEVKVNETGIFERFGKVINRNLKPGLHVKYPWPFDNIVRIKSEKVIRLEFGNIPLNKNYPVLWGTSHGENSDDKLYISGDNNFFYPYVSISYRIKDSNLFHFNIKDAKKLIKNIILNCLTVKFASEKFYDIATNRKFDLEIKLKEMSQSMLDELSSGVFIEKIIIRDVHPPVKAARSFEDVIAAMQDRIASINVALEYRIVSLPAANSAALRKVTSSRTKSQKKVALAKGKSERMLQRYLAYKVNPKVARSVLFLNFLKSSLEKCRKVIVDGDGVELWMNYEKILKTGY